MKNSIDNNIVSHDSPLVPTPSTSHQMITRLKAGIHKPNPKYANLHTTHVLPQVPKSVKSALQHEGWAQAMHEELTALKKNNTWTLIPRTPNMHVIGRKWIFKVKLDANGDVERLKARLVANGFHQLDGIDFSETYSPVVKFGTIRTVLSIALVRRWDIR